MRRARRFPGGRRTVAWLAVACGLAATVMLMAGGGSAPATRTVLVAHTALAAGTSFDSPETVAALTTARVVPATLALGGLVEDPAALVGRHAMVPVGEGEAITLAALGGSTPVAPLAPGQRAVPVPASAAGGAASTLVPGSRVDVIAAQGVGDRGRTTVVVANAEVLSVGSAAGGDPTTAAVLLRASRRDALRITAALNFAQDVRLVARPTSPVTP